MKALRQTVDLSAYPDLVVITGADQAFVPPSTVRFAPVMYDASGLATKATNAATSAAVPKRFSAVLAFCGTAQSPAAGFKSVSIGPGWTLLTVMPRAPTSLESP